MNKYECDVVTHTRARAGESRRARCGELRARRTRERRSDREVPQGPTWRFTTAAGRVWSIDARSRNSASCGGTTVVADSTPLFTAGARTPRMRRNGVSSDTVSDSSVGFTSTVPFWKSRRHTLEAPAWKCTSSNHTSPACVPRKNASVAAIDVVGVSTTWYCRQLVSTVMSWLAPELLATTRTVRGALALQRNVAA